MITVPAWWVSDFLKSYDQVAKSKIWKLALSNYEQSPFKSPASAWQSDVTMKMHWLGEQLLICGGAD